MTTKRLQISVRYIGLFLALALLVCGAGAVRADALASDDYTLWRQYDPEWNESPAWPGGWSSFMGNSGCWVTSVAMLLRHYGVVEGDVDEFNPWICCGELYAAGALTGGGDMVLGMVGEAYPGFDCAGSYSYSFDRLQELYDEGYACSVLINGGRHMVAVKAVLEDGTVEIMDPASDMTTLAECSGVTTIYCFGPIEQTQGIETPVVLAMTPEIS